MTDKRLMACGHSQNAVTGNGEPCCAICYGIHPGADKFSEENFDLSGRIARCHCGNERESNTDLPFFLHRVKHEFDSYYCGCDGWD